MIVFCLKLLFYIKTCGTASKHSTVSRTPQPLQGSALPGLTAIVQLSRTTGSDAGAALLLPALRRGHGLPVTPDASHHVVPIHNSPNFAHSRAEQAEDVPLLTDSCVMAQAGRTSADLYFRVLSLQPCIPRATPRWFQHRRAAQGDTVGDPPSPQLSPTSSLVPDLPGSSMIHFYRGTGRQCCADGR